MRSWIRILRDVPIAIFCLLEHLREGAQNLQRFITEESTAPSIENESASDLNLPNDALPDVNDRMQHDARFSSVQRAHHHPGLALRQSAHHDPIRR
jgi:hypothetical protein